MQDQPVGLTGRGERWVWPVIWLAAAAAITWSVVRFELLIVVVLTIATLALAVVAVRGGRLALGDRWQVSVLLLGIAVVVEWVPSFTYLRAGPHRWALHVVAAAAVLAALAWWWPQGRARRLAPAVALAGYLGSAIAVILGDRAPRIDVWVSLQQASDGLVHGQDAYAMIWHNSPGVTDAFTYLPWTLVLLAPGRWLAGDVRWALVAWTLVGVGAVLALGRWRSPAASAAACLLLLTPGSTTQVEQAWTEPLLFALLACWALLVHRGRTWWAVIPLALALASKQHTVLLLPVLALWPGFGWRRTAVATGGAGLLVLPWYLWSPADFWHDTVTLLVGFHPILFADTLYLAALHELGWLPPFWLTGIIVLGTIAGGAVVVHRRPPDLGGVIRWCALILFVANVVNKQAFYNQFWLVGALVLVSIAVPTSANPSRSPSRAPEPESEPVPEAPDPIRSETASSGTPTTTS